MTNSRPWLGCTQPAEWSAHDAVWLAWPSHEDLWREGLADARAAFTGFARAIADLDERGHARGEGLEVLVPDARNQSLAESALAGLPVRFHTIAFGDIWLRDTAPVFMHDPDGAVVAMQFEFNGWGGKYVLDHDTAVSAAVSAASGLRSYANDLVLEGGSVETDGDGTLLSSRQCLLNPNRNPDHGEREIVTTVCSAFGAEKLLWVTDGLENDHTDGHIDTIARFVAPGVVACMVPADRSDPNHDVLLRIVEELRGAVDARGRRLRVETVPSPGRVCDDEGRVMPASYLNFYIANRTVVVPLYGAAHDQAAVAAVQAMFPTRRAVGVQAKAILAGGGAFHCISQQQPAARDAR